MFRISDGRHEHIILHDRAAQAVEGEEALVGLEHALLGEPSGREPATYVTSFQPRILSYISK